ncbi:MAG TPA: ABC transporter permease [Bacteroidia bacterium]|jgi:ABC-2 type transport system permease protein
MLRLTGTIRKELLILLRDRGGLAIMFLMPLAMITIMALIQDAPFRDYQEMKIPLLLVNNDKAELGKTIESGLKESKIFDITALQLDEAQVKQKVKAGDYEIGIIIPANATASLNAKVSRFVSKKLTEAGLSDADNKIANPSTEAVDLLILFSPDTKKSFKASILSSLKQSSSKLETQTLLDLFSKELNKEGAEAGSNEPLENLINFKEVNTVETPAMALLLNSVQHNVPAWTIFGMFFIVISMSGSIIKERDDGSYTRILSMPGSYITVLAGKISAYLLVCLIQCILMLMVGLYLLPHLGLPTLVIGNNVPAICMVALATGLAATGFGVLVGTIFKTHQQSSTFGAVSVVILAALGGIWVPVFVMPESIRMFAEFSPLYWALSAFHKLFLNAGDIQSILPFVFKLILFFLLTIAAAFFYNKKKSS